MKTNYYIDSENCSYNWVNLIDTKKAKKIFTFTSKHGRAISIKNQDQIKTFIKMIKEISVKVGVKNALDFQLSTKIGMDIKKHPKREFVIIANDKGYDAVVDFWKTEKNINIKRVPCNDVILKEDEKINNIIKVIKESLGDSYQDQIRVIASSLIRTAKNPSNQMYEMCKVCGNYEASDILHKIGTKKLKAIRDTVNKS